MLKSLAARKNELSDPKAQLKLLNNGLFQSGELTRFEENLVKIDRFPLRPSQIEILQVNVGYMCNQVCAHCHVDAGPDRKEIMTRETMGHILNVLKKTQVHTLDLTGGAPEMNPDFRWFVESCTALGVKEVIVRSNLTIIMANKKYHDLPAFFKKHNVHVISSLPFYSKDRTDKQRGDGVFNKSIEALKKLNAEGYGTEGSDLKLDLVYNPGGAFLPGDQAGLEKTFKERLFADFGIEFNQLFALTNLPISRFLEYLIASENYEDYMDALVSAYNPATVDSVMCRNTISVDYDGYMYDCDFNQILDLKVDAPKKHISEFDMEALSKRNIKVSQHCYGCTAGAGSSCQGAVT